MYTLRDAINRIRVGAEFNTLGNTEIIWLDTTQIQPTENEITEAYLLLEQDEISKQQQKAAAQAKLAVLGLTADDLKALGLGNN